VTIDAASDLWFGTPCVAPIDARNPFTPCRAARSTRVARSLMSSSRNTKSWARLRAILSRVTVATLATAGTASAASERAPEPTIEGRTASPALQEVVARELAVRLAELPPLRAMGAAADLALSPEAPERLALAGALAWEFPLVGDQTVIDHLSRDPAADVRAAAARAAWMRRTPQLDTDVLRRLLGDEDPEVRNAAWLAIRA